MKLSKALITTILTTASFASHATLVSIDNCSGTAANGPAVTCEITNSPSSVITPNPNNNKLIAWDEVQNHTLTEDLVVDRVFDPTASFIEDAGSGDYIIKAGTIVSSHYVQWDPDGVGTIDASIVLDSQVFAFITSDQNLFDSDDQLARTGIDYNDFTLRGLENADTTVFDGSSTDISWRASAPGDWTRLITAYSPAAQVPEPASLGFMLAGLIGIISRRKK
ncbi:PEP-CTERM sorting domain-containing protein [Photobacterium minamisatsumaniensis]|uniref:PEP-CTERM sorting domain-containing protein n=1 Tax=Photobacterium minamisatsumaniensis TaxID=2910233 RepID=UPI003D0B4BFD